MKKNLILLSALIAAHTLNASQPEEEAAWQHAQLCALTAVASFGIAYVICKKCFDKKTEPTAPQPELPPQVQPAQSVATAKKEGTKHAQKPAETVTGSDYTKHGISQKNQQRIDAWHKKYGQKKPYGRTIRVHFTNTEQIKEIEARQEQTAAEYLQARLREKQRRVNQLLGIE